MERGLPGRAGPRHQPRPDRDILRCGARRGPRVPRRHGALQALPDAARALLRGHRSGPGRAGARRSGDGCVAKRARSLAGRSAVEAVARAGDVRLPLPVRGRAGDAAAPQGRDQHPRALCGVRLPETRVLGRVAVVLGAGGYRDLRARRAAGDEAESALSAPQGPGPVRSGDGARRRAERERDGAHAVAARLAVDRARPRTAALPSSAPRPVVVRKWQHDASTAPAHHAWLLGINVDEESLSRSRGWSGSGPPCSSTGWSA